MKEYINQSSNSDEFSNAEFEEKYLTENKYTKQIPAYIRDYNKFCKLLILFSNYINTATVTLEQILNKLNVNSATGNILEMLAKRYDINIDKPVDEHGNVNQELYETQLKLAILSVGIKKSSVSNRTSLNNIMSIISGINRINIFDSNQMSINISMSEDSTAINSSLLEKYLIPNITGVNTVVTYLLSNSVYFGFDRDDAIQIIGSITETTENVTQSLLDTTAENLGITPVIGSTIIDGSGNGWVYMNSQWINRGATTVDDEGKTVIDEIEGYAIRGWDIGKWAQTKVL